MAKKLINVIYKVDDSQLNKVKSTIQANEKEAKKFSDQLKNAGEQGKKAGKDASDSFFNFGNVVKAISLGVLIQQTIQWGKEVIRIRGEFQKFEAVLTNTLGSKSAALIALGRINDFARSTPFGVAELTNSFIKLANRGVEPTIKEMRAIADLSATLGKDFDQVIEAILDINNPERWKEIGIKAETAGDKVKLSFRDAKIEVDRTVRGVTNAVTALGQLNGVAGSTEAISKTLSGQMSNLSDTMDQLFNALGQSNESVLSKTVNMLNQALEAATKLVKGEAQLYDELAAETLAAETQRFEERVKTLKSIEKAEEEFAKRQDDLRRENAEKLDKLMATEESKRRNQEEIHRLRLLEDIYSLDLPKAIEETIKKIRQLQAANAAEAHRKLMEQAAKDSKKLGKEVNDYLAYLSDLEMFNIRELLADRRENRQKTADAERDAAKRSADHVAYYEELKKKKVAETEAEKIRIMEDAAARKRRIEEDIFYASVTFARALTDAIFESRQSEIDQLQDYYNEQQRLAGDNARFREELDIRRERAIKQAREREKEEEKRRARGRIIAETAINIVEAFPNFVLMGLATALGAVQLATVQRLKDGGWVKGPGTETSDSVPALLSKNEFVVNADAAKRSPMLLDAINSKKLSDEALRGAARNGGFSDKGIREELRNVIKELQSNRPDDLVERHGLLMRATKRSRDHVQFVRAKVMGDI